MDHYVLKEEVEATVVTESYLGTLPRMGGNPQRVKDAAEIVGPRGEKSYARLDDYIIKVGDYYLAVPKSIFVALFAQVSDTQPVVPESPPSADTPSASDPNESTPVGESDNQSGSAPESEPTLDDSQDDLPEIKTPTEASL